MKAKHTAVIAVCAAVAVVAAVLTGILVITGGTLDVIGKGAVRAFGELLDAEGITVTADSETGGWSLGAPDGSIRLLWSTEDSRSPLYDVLLEFDAQPFLNAGLDPEKLPASYTLRENRLTVGVKYGDSRFSEGEDSSPLAAFTELAEACRSELGYHASMGHYNLALGDDALLEWAQDMRENGMDLVFALSPEPLIAAGVDPEQVEGWSYTEVPVGHSDSSETVPRLLKAFDIR